MIRFLDDDMTVFLYHLANVGNHKIWKMLNSEKIFNSENGKMGPSNRDMKKLKLFAPTRFGYFKTSRIRW